MWYNLLTVSGILIIFLATALGASVVFFFKGEISPKINAVFFGFASGVMVASSIWSLILPALALLSVQYGSFAFMPVALFAPARYSKRLPRLKIKGAKAV